MSAADVLVTGARGKTGREVAAQLVARDVRVRAGSRIPGPATGRVRPVRFDWEDHTTWAEAVAGVDAVYLMRPDLEDAPERVAQLVHLAADAHVVLLSEQGAGDLPAASWERRVERAVTESGSAWTLLRPSWFNQVLTDPRFYLDAIREHGVLPMPSAGAGVAFVDARDIAAVAVAAILDPEHPSGASFTITGPAAITVDAVAGLVTSASGRPVSPVDPPVTEAVAGLEPWLSHIYSGVLERVAKGVYGDLTDDVARVTGRPPHSLEGFVRDHADLWAAP